MSGPITDPPRVQLICMGPETHGLHDANTVGIAHWLTADRMRILTSAGLLAGAEHVGREGNRIFAYDLECDQCHRSLHLDLDQGWRQRLLAAAHPSGVGQLDISDDLN
jgi:hypothetical protein